MPRAHALPCPTRAQTQLYQLWCVNREEHRKRPLDTGLSCEQPLPKFSVNSNFLRCTRRLCLFAPHCLTAFVSRFKIPRLHRYHVRAKGPLHRVAARVRPPGGQPVTRAAKIDMSKLKTWYATEGLRCACGARRNGIRSEDAATGSREASGGGRSPPTEHCGRVFSRHTGKK